MDQTPHFVVYHSERERMIDQFLVSGQLMPFIFGVIAFFVAFLGMTSMLSYLAGKRLRADRDHTNLLLFVSAGVGIIVTVLTWV